MFIEPKAEDRRAHWNDVVVLIGDVDARVAPAVRFVADLPEGRRRALHVSEDLTDSHRVVEDWIALGLPWLPLEVCDGTGSSVAVAAAAAILDEGVHPHDVTVVLPELSSPQWWYPLLHRRRARQISTELQALGFATFIVPYVLEPRRSRRRRATRATRAAGATRTTGER